MSRWYSANVLQSLPGGRRLWHFSAKGDRFVFGSEKTLSLSESAPSAEAAKNWQSYFRPKLNVVWLPTDKVFLRAVQLPGADPSEFASMVELQLEKLSPLPVTHIVWSLHLMPPIEGKPDALRTVIVIIAARSYVEEFLGELEGQGFLADRIECPGLDQLLSAKLNGEGLWIFPAGTGEPVLLVWHYGGTVQNITLLPLPEGEDCGPQLRGHVEQIVWAGELEGWLTAPPRIHLVAGPAEAAHWKPLLADIAADTVDIVAPQSPAELAAASAERSGHNGVTTNLLPVEYSKRYHQQLVDHLWMRFLTGVLGVYLLGVLGYFAALFELQHEDNKAHATLAKISLLYTNALADESQIQILIKRQNLKYAALDCWKAVAETLPANLTLQSFYFNVDKLRLTGDSTANDPQDVYSFHEGMRQAEDASQSGPLFSDLKPPLIQSGSRLTWSFEATLKSREEP